MPNGREKNGSSTSNDLCLVFMKLIHKQIVFGLIPLVLLLGLLGAVLYHNSTVVLKKEMNSRIALTVNHIRQLIFYEIESLQKEILNIALNDLLDSYLMYTKVGKLDTAEDFRARLEEFLSRYQSIHRELKNIEVMQVDGTGIVNVTSGTATLRATGLADTVWVRDTLRLKEGEFYVSDPFVSDIDKRPSLSVSMLHHINHRPAVLIRAVINVQECIGKKLESLSLGHGGTFGLVDQNGVVVFHADTAQVGKNIGHLSSTPHTSRGQTVMTYHTVTPLNIKGFSIMISQPVFEAFGSTRQIKLFSLWSTGMIGFVMLLFIYFSNQKFLLRPLEEFSKAVKDIADGHLGARVGFSSNDELGQLADGFNRMAENLSAVLEREKKLAAEVMNADVIKRDAAEIRLAYDKVSEKTRELEKVNAELDSFVYTASHDLRAPLRGISSFATFLEEDYKDKFDEEGREYLSEIRKGANMLSELIEDLLALSHVSRIRNPYETVGIKDIVDAVLERLKLYIRERKAEVVVADGFPTIRCDRIKVTEVFVNLINNGIKFSSKDASRPCRIEIGHTDAGKFYQFYVKDNGIGIDPKYHDQIFGIFKRLHTNEDYEGTGAGLCIVKKIVEEHQGRIWIESEPGKGAKFNFTIPKNLQEKKKIGDILVEEGIISRETLNAGLKKQQQ